MKILYFDCSMGAAGDMIMGALYDLMPEKETYLNQLNHMKLNGVTITVEESIKCGITGTHMRVKVYGGEEKSFDVKQENKMECEHHAHHEEHSHHEHHGHHEEHSHHEHHSHHEPHVHRTIQDIEQMIQTLDITDEVKIDAINIYKILAEAESKVHGKDVSEVHFHEVGMLDAVADIVGCAMLINELKVDEVVVSPINVGYGQVKCAHGILPVPAPATANILRGVPCYGGSVEGELCTPTGAAIITYYADKYMQLPAMTIGEIGYGMGTKDFGTANCLRAVLGEVDSVEDNIIELKCNIDDMTGEEIGYAVELLLKSGANDVYTTAIGMKKGRPGTMLSVMCSEKMRNKFAKLIFQHTSTSGIREYQCNRMILSREEYTKDTSLGSVNVKKMCGYGVSREKIEYEDLKRIADREGISIREVKEQINVQ